MRTLFIIITFLFSLSIPVAQAATQTGAEVTAQTSNRPNPTVKKVRKAPVQTAGNRLSDYLKAIAAAITLIEAVSQQKKLRAQAAELEDETCEDRETISLITLGIFAAGITFIEAVSRIIENILY